MNERERQIKHRDPANQSGGTLTKLAFKHGHRDSLIPRLVSNVQKC